MAGTGHRSTRKAFGKGEGRGPTGMVRTTGLLAVLIALLASVLAPSALAADPSAPATPEAPPVNQDTVSPSSEAPQASSGQSDPSVAPEPVSSASAAPAPTPSDATVTPEPSAPPSEAPAPSLLSSVTQPAPAAAADLVIPFLDVRPYSNNAMDLSWSPPFAGAKVKQYSIRRDGQEIAVTKGLAQQDTGLAPNTSYSYQVQAALTDGRTALSRTVTAKTGTIAAYSSGILVPTFAPSGIDGAGFQNVIAASALEPQRLLLGGDVAGINSSVDGGGHWVKGNAGLWRPEQLHIGDVEWSPTVRGKGYMCTSWLGKGGGFFVTTDGGHSWTERNSQASCHGGLTSAAGLPRPHPRPTGNLMAIDKSNGYIYLATYNSGVMRSTDDGRTWTTLGLAGKYLRSLVLDPSNPNVVYVASYNDGIYVTTNARAAGTLSKISGSTPTPEELSIVDNVLWVTAGTNGVFQGTGSGANRTFTKASLVTNGKTAYYTITGYKPATGAAVLYVGTFEGPKVGNSFDNMSKSTDGGRTWRSITLDPSKINYVPWGGTQPWWLMLSQPSFAIGKSAFVASQIVVDPTRPQTVYVAGRSGAWRSDDGGENWRPAVQGIGATITRDAAVDASGDGVFVALADYVMVQSKDGGAYFKVNKPPQGNVGYGVSVDNRAANPVVYLGVGERDTNTQGDVWRNDNPFNGGTWVSENLGAKTGNKRVLSVSFLPKAGGGRILLAAADGGGLWRKEDSGAWVKVSSEISATATNGGDSRKIVRGAASSQGVLFIYDPVRGVYRSKDLGKTWTNIWNKATTGDYEGFLAVDQTNPNILYVAPGDSVYRIDGADSATVGTGLTPVNLNVRNPGPVHVSRDGTVWVAQEVSEGSPAALLRSTDRGARWFPVEDELWQGTVAHATSLTVFAAADPQKIRAFVTLDGTGMLIATMRSEGNPSDLEAPTAIVCTPADFEWLPEGSPVTISGTATDNVGVTAVDIEVFRYDDQTYLQPDGRFGPAPARIAASLGTPAGTDTTWTYQAALPPGRYTTTAHARDAAGMTTVYVDPVDFGVQRTVNDAAVPVATVTVPSSGQELSGGSPVTLSGTATDDLSVAGVAIAVQRMSDSLWLQGDGSWGTWVQQPATLSSPGSTQSNWSFVAQLSPGKYGVQAQPFDSAGKSGQRIWRAFSVVQPAQDTTPPSSTVSVPSSGQAFVAGQQVTLRGQATDNVGIAKVGVAIQRLSDKLWLRTNGTWGSYQLLAATLVAPGQRNTEWRYAVTLPAGQYGLQTVATDSSGLTGQTSAWRKFQMNPR